MGQKITVHTELEVYRKAFEAAMAIFALSKSFPKEEVYSLTDQIRRSSRSVCANLSEAWRARRYEKTFRHKLGIAEGEAAETQTWLEFAVRCEYISLDEGRELYRSYDSILSTIVGMTNHADTWLLKKK
ncbi:MAG: four helix bundle protein [Caldilineaceae bacterium]